MRQSTLSIPEIGMIAATRGMLGAGVGLLLSSKIAPEKRPKIAWPLVAIGALSTVPLVIDIVKKSKPADSV